MPGQKKYQWGLDTNSVIEFFRSDTGALYTTVLANNLDTEAFRAAGIQTEIEEGEGYCGTFYTKSETNSLVLPFCDFNATGLADLLAAGGIDDNECIELDVRWTGCNGTYRFDWFGVVPIVQRFPNSNDDFCLVWPVTLKRKAKGGCIVGSFQQLGDPC